jgi:hypothetical protein
MCERPQIAGRPSFSEEGVNKPCIASNSQTAQEAVELEEEALATLLLRSRCRFLDHRSAWLLCLCLLAKASLVFELREIDFQGVFEKGRRDRDDSRYICRAGESV